MQHYLDNASTTPVADAAANAVLAALRQGWANPSSLYEAGAEAEAALQAARGVLAGALGCAAKEVFFTSGGTEGNNMAVLGAARARKAWANHIVTTGYEHPSVSGPARLLAREEGFEVTEIAPGTDGRVDEAALGAAVGKKTALVCAMQVNNETGAILNVAAIAAAVKAKNPRCFVHVDGVQGFCRLPLRLADTQIDSYAVSGHKLRAPKGVGALYIRGGKDTHLARLMAGGGQEENVRPGTENTAGIAGFAAAVQLALENKQTDTETIAALRARLVAGLAALDGVKLHEVGGYAGILMFSMPRGLRSQVVLNFLDENYGVCLSAGSACSGGAPSHTLTAMGLPNYEVETALRVSLSGQNTNEDIDALLRGLADGMQTLARA